MALFFTYQFERSLVTRLLCPYLSLIYQKFVILSHAEKTPVLSEVQNHEYRQHCCLPVVKGCPGFHWHRVNFPPSSCSVLDSVREECR